MKYEIFEHTADIGIKVYGKDYDELFNNSIESFADLIVDANILGTKKLKRVSLKSNSPDLLLVDLLSLVLYEFEANGILYFKSNLKYDEENKVIRGTLSGSPVSEDTEYRNVIKAVTYHNVSVSPEKGYATIIFDI